MRKLFIFVAIAFASLYVSAQTVYVGPKLGIDLGSPIPFSNMPQGAKGEPKMGFNVGAFFTYAFNDIHSISYEAGLVRKHTVFETPLDSMEYVERIQHPTLPDVVFEVDTWFTGKASGAFDNYYFEQSLQHNFNVNTRLKVSYGLYYAILQKSNTYAVGVGTVGYDPEIVTQELDYSSNMRRVDYGVKAGVLVKATERTDLGLKLNYGMKSVFVDSFTMIDYSVNNTFLELALYYKFNVLKNLTEKKV